MTTNVIGTKLVNKEPVETGPEPVKNCTKKLVEQKHKTFKFKIKTYMFMCIPYESKAFMHKQAKLLISIACLYTNKQNYSFI